MENSPSTALAYFVFARPEHTAKSLASLVSNNGGSEMPLYIFSDAGRTEDERARVTEVRNLLQEVEGFRGVYLIMRQHNLGCAKNIIDGVSQVLQSHESVIVVEDDLQLSLYFIEFVKRALDTYVGREDIFSISAASPPPHALGTYEEAIGDVYLAPRTVPWGWATWRNRWQQVDWRLAGYSSSRWRPAWRRRMARGGNDLLSMLDDQMAGRIDSWNVRFNHAQAMAGSYSVYPKYSYVRNVGLDGSGRHCRAADRHEIELDQAIPVPVMPPDIRPEKDILRAVKAYHDEHPLSLLLGSIPGLRRLIRTTKMRLGIYKPLLKKP